MDTTDWYDAEVVGIVAELMLRHPNLTDKQLIVIVAAYMAGRPDDA